MADSYQWVQHGDGEWVLYKNGQRTDDPDDKKAAPRRPDLPTE